MNKSEIIEAGKQYTPDLQSAARLATNLPYSTEAIVREIERVEKKAQVVEPRKKRD